MNRILFFLLLSPTFLCEKLRFTLSSEVESLDPIVTDEENTFMITSNLYETIVKYDRDGNLKPGLAKSWTRKGNKIIFQIREAFWSDGSKISIEDIIFSFERILTASNGCRYSHLIYYIKNGEKFHKGLISSFSEVGIKKVNEDRFEIEFRDELSTEALLAPLTFVCFAPVSKSIAARVDFGQHSFISSGPYKVEEWDQGHKLKLVKNDRYREKVRYDELEISIVKDEYTAINMFEGGLIDFIPSVLPTVLQHMPKIKAKAKKYNRYEVVFINFNCKKLKKETRKKIAKAIDRKKLCSSVVAFAKPAYSLIPPSFPGYISKKIIKEKKTNFSFGAIELLCEKNTTNIKVASFIKEELSSLGLDVKISALPKSLYIQKKKDGKFDISLNSWIADYFGPPLTFFELLKGGSASNFSFWDNIKFNEKYKSENLEELEEYIFKEEYPIAPLYFPEGYYLAKKHVSRGVSSRNPDFSY